VENGGAAVMVTLLEVAAVKFTDARYLPFAVQAQPDSPIYHMPARSSFNWRASIIYDG
jgi:hypothetical protein